MASTKTRRYRGVANPALHRSVIARARSNAATPVPSGTRYRRTRKHAGQGWA